MLHIDYVVRTLDHTAHLARRLYESLPRPLIFGLTGELGSGKTAFVQALAKELGIKERVQSPTFTLINEYPYQGGRLIHADLYRTNSHEEIAQLGLTDTFDLPNVVVAVEWADRAERIFPPSTVWLNFILTDSHRVVRLTQNSEAINQLLPLGQV